jgi:hypothetical protein
MTYLRHGCGSPSPDFVVALTLALSMADAPATAARFNHAHARDLLAFIQRASPFEKRGKS